MPNTQPTHIPPSTHKAQKTPTKTPILEREVNYHRKTPWRTKFSKISHIIVTHPKQHNIAKTLDSSPLSYQDNESCKERQVQHGI